MLISTVLVPGVSWPTFNEPIKSVAKPRLKRAVINQPKWTKERKAKCAYMKVAVWIHSHPYCNLQEVSNGMQIPKTKVQEHLQKLRKKTNLLQNLKRPDGKLGYFVEDV